MFIIKIAQNILNIFPIRKKVYSIRKSFIFIMSTIAIACIGMILVITLYFTSVVRTKTYENIKDTMALYNQQESQRLYDLQTYLFQLATYETNISLLSTKNSTAEAYPYIAKIKVVLETSLPTFSDIEGLFLYFPGSDSFMSARKNNEQIACSNYCKTLFRNARLNSSFDTINTNQWFSVNIEEADYFFRIMKIDNIYIGAWSSIRQLTSAFKEMKALNADLVYVNTQGHAMGNKELAYYTFDPLESLNSYSVFRNGQGNKYLLVTSKLDYCDYYLMAFIPWKSITPKLAPVYQMLLVFIGIIIIITILLIYSINGFLSQPIHALKQVTSSMRDGKLDSKISNNHINCEEIIVINSTFNNMIDEIYRLHADIYEEKLAKKEVELQLLKSQIAPHFLINCLYTTLNLADDASNHDSVQKMVQTLSDHLRYTLSGKTTVSLAEEIKHVKNYLELTELRFPGCLFYSFDLSEDAQNASVFPLILLVLTENTIKHNMIMGEFLTVKIIGYTYVNGSEKRMHLTHIDTGEGFRQATLNEITKLAAHPAPKVDGKNIGLYNIAKRLKLIYNESATIQFANEPGSGARIDIDFPYMDYIPDRFEEEAYH